MRLVVHSHSLAALCALMGLHSGAAAQALAANAGVIVEAFNTTKTRWIFHHLCIPWSLTVGGHTQGDFVQAYFDVARLRWEASPEALAKNDDKASLTALAPIVHSITDAYWPGRLERNNAGAITQFADCESLGSLQGIQKLEDSKFAGGPSGKDLDRAIDRTSRLLRLWKERKPFEEVAAVLQGGPMKLEAQAVSRPLPISKQHIDISRVDGAYLWSVPGRSPGDAHSLPWAAAANR